MSNLMKKNFHVVERNKIWFSISIAIILIGVIVMCIFGLNIGIDFTGGGSLEVVVGRAYTDETADAFQDIAIDFLTTKMSDERGDYNLNANNLNPAQSTSTNSDSAGFTIRFSLPEVEGETENEVLSNIQAFMGSSRGSYDLSVLIQEKASEVLGTEVGKESIEINLNIVSSTASGNLIKSTVWAIILSVVLMLAYITIRFRFTSGVAAVVALLHDVLIMLAFMAFFRVQINTSFIAAVITIIGYSINNTIVVFDRIRENTKRLSLKDASATEITNRSLKETLSRSINTTITTLVTIVCLYILGGSSIREFAFPIIIGLLAGAYSSFFIAPTGWALFNDWYSKKKGKKTYIREPKVKADKTAKAEN